jgi:hypothetical protein
LGRIDRWFEEAGGVGLGIGEVFGDVSIKLSGCGSDNSEIFYGVWEIEAWCYALWISAT